MTPDADLNPRYLAYCKYHGRSVEQQRSHDANEYPGGKMCGFILWVDEHIRAFFNQHPECFYNQHLLRDQDTFTAWLNRQKQSQNRIRTELLESGNGFDSKP
jgi:hypothetical protein